MRSKASTKTASCAASCASSQKIAAHQLFPAPAGRLAEALSLGEASRAARSICLPLPRPALRDLRLLARAWRACICAPARSRAAASAGPTAKRISAPRSSALMKAQMVKNAVIVPVGSKGGFVVKRPPTARAEQPAEGVECYKILMRGLLDLTDNIVRRQRLVPPRRRRAPRRRRSLSRRRRRQRHRDLLRYRQRRFGRNTASGSATPSPRAARPATTTRRWASPRAAPGSW